MSNDTFTFNDISGQTAKLEINNRDSHLTIYWGKLCIEDTSGEIGFWTTWNKTGKPWLKGAALNAALHKYAKTRIESAIYDHMQWLQETVAEADSQ